MNIRRILLTVATVLCALAGAITMAQAEPAEPADAFVRRISNDILESIKADKSMQAGDARKLATLVDSKVMPSLGPVRGNAGDEEVVVRTEVRGAGDPVQLDYRLEQADSGWKIYDVNILGGWRTIAAALPRRLPTSASMG
jgi:phospholipid transport system substrate-binding protein